MSTLSFPLRSEAENGEGASPANGVEVDTPSIGIDIFFFGRPSRSDTGVECGGEHEAAAAAAAAAVPEAIEVSPDQ